MQCMCAARLHKDRISKIITTLKKLTRAGTPAASRHKAFSF